jgi:hypothetical protein
MTPRTRYSPSGAQSPVSRQSEVAARTSLCGGYWRAMAMLRRSSGEMRWSRSSAASAMSICTHSTVPVKRLPSGVYWSLTGDAVSEPMSQVSSPEKASGTVASRRPSPVLGAVEVEGDVAALAEFSAVVGELHAHLVGARRDGRVAGDVGVLHAEQVVGVGRPAVLDVQAPAAERAALGDDHAFGAAVWDRHLGGHRAIPGLSGSSGPR